MADRLVQALRVVHDKCSGDPLLSQCSQLLEKLLVIDSDERYVAPWRLCTDLILNSYTLPTAF